MYKEYYGLREMPFHITPDPRFLFLAPTHQEALQHLRYGIEERKGFMVLTGEVGCGKTTLCRKLLDELDPHQYQTALILNPRLTETQLLKFILNELGAEHAERNRGDLLNRLNEHLLELIGNGKEIILIIDESQNLSFDALEHIRLLSNLETDTQKLLQIILLGQPELKEKLNQKRLRQLRQRILVFYDLQSLNEEETSCYIQHRLTMAGGNGRPSFSQRASRRIYQASGGIPRIINNLCDKSLLAAYVRDSDEVGSGDVKKAQRELSLR